MAKALAASLRSALCIVSVLSAITLLIISAGVFWPQQRQVHEAWVRCNVGSNARLCTPEGFTWRTWHRYDQPQACALLDSRGVRHVKFVGDSYMRQLFMGVALTLSGNYEAGSLTEPLHNCSFEKQFEDKLCRFHVNSHINTCDGKVQLSYLNIGCIAAWNLEELAMCESSQLLLVSYGNHPMDLDYTAEAARPGVNNAVLTRKELLARICPLVMKQTGCNLWWVSTHQRLTNGLLDEEQDIIRCFNTGMRTFFESHRCGSVRFIDMFNMTDQLIERPEASSLTYDGVHWGMTVNLLKSQVLLSGVQTHIS